MKTLIHLSLVIIVAALAGCSSTPIAILDPVGPTPPGSAETAVTGQLIVYSEFSLLQSTLNPVDSGGDFHTDYAILSKEGKFIRNVRNYEGFRCPVPATVQLPPGEYRIQAQANGYPNVIVPVQIEPNQTTEVRLDGSVSDEISKAQTNAVRLPDGAVIGWRAIVKK